MKNGFLRVTAAALVIALLAAPVSPSHGRVSTLGIPSGNILGHENWDGERIRMGTRALLEALIPDGAIPENIDLRAVIENSQDLIGRLHFDPLIPCVNGISQTGGKWRMRWWVADVGGGRPRSYISEFSLGDTIDVTVYPEGIYDGAQAGPLTGNADDAVLGLSRAIETYGTDELRAYLSEFMKNWAKVCSDKATAAIWMARYDELMKLVEKASFKILGIDNLWEYRLEKPIKVILTGAGMGSRMSDPNYPKVLYEVAGKPMLLYVLDITSAMTTRGHQVVVVRPENWFSRETFFLPPDRRVRGDGPGTETEIKRVLAENGYTVDYALQHSPLGDADVILRALESDVFSGFDGDVLILWGDLACAYEETITRAMILYRALGDISFMPFIFLKEEPYAQVILNSDGTIGFAYKHKGPQAKKPPVGYEDVGIFIGSAPQVLAALRNYPYDELPDRNRKFINPGCPGDRTPGNYGEATFAQAIPLIGNVLGFPVADPKEFANVNDDRADGPIATRYRQEAEEARVNMIRTCGGLDALTDLMARMTLTEIILDAAYDRLAEITPEEDVIPACRLLAARLSGFLNGSKGRQWAQYLDRKHPISAGDAPLAQEAGHEAERLMPQAAASHARLIGRLPSGKTRLIVDENIFEAGAYEKDITGRLFNGRYIAVGDICDLEKCDTTNIGRIIHMLKNSDCPPEKTIVQVSGEVDTDLLSAELTRENLGGVRFIRVDTNALAMKYNRDKTTEEKWKLRIGLYAMMLAARDITDEDMRIEEASPVYRLLMFLLKAHGAADPRAYISEFSKDNISCLAKYALSFIPLERWSEEIRFHLLGIQYISGAA
ncbi:MAG: hypothetical protein ABH885_01815 [Candidatus Omnitrophota bacterium]